MRLLCGGCYQSCPNKSANKTSHRWCQYRPPKQSKRADFCWARCCRWTHCASWTADALINALHLTNVPHSRETFSNNVPREEGYKLVRRSGWMTCSQVLHAAVVRPLKDSGVPEIAVTTDASLVEREQLCETRWRLAERESDPDGLEPARANPPLSCRY